MSSELQKPVHTHRFEELLRVIGRYIDANGLRDVMVLQSKGEFHLHGWRNTSSSGSVKPAQVRHVFTVEDVGCNNEQSRKLRGKGLDIFR
jgi:hypothetical protein